MGIPRLVGALIVIVALGMPAAAVAQDGNPYAHSVSLVASLGGDAEVPGGDADGFGFARIAISLETRQFCFRLSVAGTDVPVAAHIHEGGPGVAGPVVIPLQTSSDGLSHGCVDVAAELVSAIVADPGSYYVNVHTAEYPAGAVRGQLAPLSRQRSIEPPAGPLVETIADGLTSPRGIDIDADGAVYILDGGSGDVPDDENDCFPDEEAGEVCVGRTGSVLKYAGGTLTPVATALPPFPSDVVVSGTGDVYVVIGFGGDPAERAAIGELGYGLGDILETHAESWTLVADVSACEAVANPDGGEIDTNPYALAIVGDGFLVADAGANALFHVASDGTFSTYAVFPDRMVDAPPFEELPEGTQIPMQSVPTSMVRGPDGANYVGELTGYPFEVGAARVWRVLDANADGDALDDGETSVYASGFTNILDIAFDSHNRLYVLEIAKDGLLAAEDPENPAGFTGALLRVEADGSVTEVMSDGLVAPTGLAIGPDDTLYVSNFGVMPGMGQVLRITLTGE